MEISEVLPIANDKYFLHDIHRPINVHWSSFTIIFEDALLPQEQWSQRGECLLRFALTPVKIPLSLKNVSDLSNDSK
jgi:hypothetical protein